MLEIFFENRKQNFLQTNFRPIVGTFQTILRKKFLYAEMPLSASLFRRESSIQKHAGSSGAATGGRGVQRGEALSKKKIERKILRQKMFSKNFQIFFQNNFFS